ncbi:MAG: hypothetical protein KGO53_07775 [Alphaproteobacteria bacterium]|nr:hypothetical protein [Alphaproteobacteria bacterium]
MEQRKPVPAFSPADMKRRKARALVMALLLVAFIVIVFITTVYKIKAGVGG